MSYSGTATYTDRSELWTIDIDVNSPTFGEYILNGTIPGEQQWRGTSSIVDLGPDWMWEGDEEESNCGIIKEVEQIDANTMRVTFTDWHEWIRSAIKAITA